MRLRKFPARELRKKRSSKIGRKKQWFKYLRQPSFLFFFCNLDGSGKVLKLLCDVWKEVISKMQKIVRVLSCDCLGDRCRWCYFWRMQEAFRRVLINWMVYFYRPVAISSYCWSFEVLTFLWAFLRAPTVLLMQCTSISAEKKFMFCFTSFFLTWITTGGTGYQNKKRSMSSKEK